MEYYNKLDKTYIQAINSSLAYPCLKVELLSQDETVLGEFTKDISNEDSGSITVNYQQGVRRSCTLNLINFNGNYTPKFNNKLWLTNKFKVYIGMKINYYTKKLANGEVVKIVLENDVGYNFRTDNPDPPYFSIATENSATREGLYSSIKTDIYWFSQGVYVLTNPSVMRELSKTTVTLNGVDKFGLFGSETGFHETEGTYLIPAYTQVSNIIKDIIKLDMGNGHPIDTKSPRIDSEIGVQSLPYDIQKSPNTYFSEMLTEIGNVFAADIYYNVDGVLTVSKGNELISADTLPSLWGFNDEEKNYLNPKIDLDFTKVYNVIKVIGNNPTASIYEAQVKNTDVASPTCVQKIGEKIKYIESTFCYNKSRTIDFAKYLLRKYSILQSTINFETPLMPHLDVNKVVTISDSILKQNNQRFIIQSLTIPLSTKSMMSVEASNTANIPYFEY